MLANIRSAIFFTGLVGWTLVFWPVAVSVFFCEPKFRSRVIGIWSHFVVWLLKIVCGLRHRVEGLENLPDRPAVLFAKHQSAWETIAFQTIFPPQGWVMKRSLLYIPFFGWGLAATGPIKINRSSPLKALSEVVRQGKQVLEEGRFVVIFPEGTRIAPGEHGTYYASASLLAIQAKAPLVPVAHNSGDYWRRREFRKRPGEICVRIGKPIDPKGLKAKELNRKAENWMRKTMPEISASYAKEPSS